MSSRLAGVRQGPFCGSIGELLTRIIHEWPRLSRKSFNRKPEACALRVGERTERPKRRRTNLRSVPGFGLNERPQQLKTIRLKFMNNPG